jgi:hyperosmotically inducible periplasmic protein
MKRKIPFLSLCAVLVISPVMMAAQYNQPAGQSGGAADQNNPDTWSPQVGATIVKQIRDKVTGLTDYGVFDSLRFGIKGRTVVLMGYASRPVLKSEAEKVVKGIEGVESVDNQIQVLPPSPNDDQIRIGVYRRIYSQAALRKYTGSPVGFGEFPSVARAAGGITQDPPMGYHAIHIVVNNGHVILSGVVDSEQDADIAAIQANSTPGVFSVENDLLYPDGKSQKK